MFVTCDFIGRLGNQLWQIAAVLGYAKKYGVRYGFPSYTLNRKEWPLYFNLPKMSGYSKTHREPQDLGYAEIPFYPKGVKLHGFFQSYKYFNSEVVDKMKEMLGFNFDPHASDYVSVHVRRGDFLALTDTFPVLPMRYYEDAIKYMREQGHEKFMVFSDDPEWCKENFDFPVACNDPVTDLKLMSSCAHHIIANSSFSWWAARFGTGTVVAPKQWYGPGNAYINIEYLIPDQWLRL